MLSIVVLTSTLRRHRSFLRLQTAASGGRDLSDDAGPGHDGARVAVGDVVRDDGVHDRARPGQPVCVGDADPGRYHRHHWCVDGAGCYAGVVAMAPFVIEERGTRRERSVLSFYP